MPLCIKNTLQKIIILDITPTALNLLTWDLVPRWTITLYLHYLNDHYSPTYHDTFVTLFRKSPLVHFYPWLLKQLCRYTRKGLFYPTVEKESQVCCISEIL